MSFRRVIVIAPTRGTCVNLHQLLSSKPDFPTLLMEQCGDEFDAAIADLPQGGFGVVAGTGAGKSVGIYRICELILSGTLKIGIVTLEHQSDDTTRHKNILVITPGVALQWAKNGKLSKSDLIILDEVHQTSEHLEFSMALLKRGCTFVWLSATVDPQIYREYLQSRTLIECSAYDPDRRADISYYHDSPKVFLEDCLPAIAANNEGVALFVSTRAEAESLANQFNGQHGVTTGFYHGGEPAEKLRAYVQGKIPRPFVIIMTSAGASSLNIAGLNRVVIHDQQYCEIVDNGRRRLRLIPLPNNTLLQMGGRVDGRATNGQIDILLTTRSIDYRALKPTTPAFLLGGALEQLCLISAHQGIDVTELDIIGEFDTKAYQQLYKRLVGRGIITETQGKPRLTPLGRKLESLPVDVAWGELILKAVEADNPLLLQTVATAAGCSDIYNMTTRKWSRYAAGDFVVPGSDHLTCQNFVSDALQQFGRVKGEQYWLEDDFNKWAKENSLSFKAIKEATLLLASIYRQLGMPLPDPNSFHRVRTDNLIHKLYVELLAGVQSMEFVYEERHPLVGPVFGNSQSGVSRGQAVLGHIRHWTDKHGLRRATIEGTEIPRSVLLRYAKSRPTEIIQCLSDERWLIRVDLMFGGIAIATREVEQLVADLPNGALAELLWNNWIIFRPELILPTAHITECIYGHDHQGRPLMAYGTMTLNTYGQNVMSVSPFKTFWTRDREEAMSKLKEALTKLTPSERTKLESSAELNELVQQAENLHLQLSKLYEQHSDNLDLDDVVPTLRADINELHRNPPTRSETSLIAWINRANALITYRLPNALATLERQAKRKDARLSELRQQALDLRNQVNNLLVDHKDDLPDDLYDRLAPLDIDDDQLPLSVLSLQVWITDAENAVQQAKQFVDNLNKQPNLDMLRTHFTK